VVLNFCFCTCQIKKHDPRRFGLKQNLFRFYGRRLQKGLVHNIASQPVMVIPLAFTRSITTPGNLVMLHAAPLDLGCLPIYGAGLALTKRYGTKLFSAALVELKVSPPPSLILWAEVDPCWSGELLSFWFDGSFILSLLNV
jgi:hypothetical protein